MNTKIFCDRLLRSSWRRWFIVLLLLQLAVWVIPYFTRSLNADLLLDQLAIVRHAPDINGRIEGSVQQLEGEGITLNGGAVVTGDLLVPGTPAVRINGHPSYQDTLDGSGGPDPSDYQVTLNSNSTLRYVRRKTDPVALDQLPDPPMPSGTRDVTLTQPGDNPGDFGTIRDITLSANVGTLEVPPGTYGSFSANSQSLFIFGETGSLQPLVYNLQQLTLNSGSELRLLGPVIVNVASEILIDSNAILGEQTQSEWLVLNVTSGRVTIVNTGSLYGVLRAPASKVIVNGLLDGSLFCDRLLINQAGILRLRDRNQPPSVDAGPDQTITLPNSANLSGVVVDDGFPLGSVVAVSWSMVSGPGTVTFADPGTVETIASFSDPGVYVLRLTASDSRLFASDDLTVTVNPATPVNQPPAADAGPDLTVKLEANLLRNPSNEEPLEDGEIPGWTEVVNNTWAKPPAGTGAFPGSFDGQTYFYAGEVEQAELRQDVDVRAFAADIDAGIQQFEFKAYLRSNPEAVPDSGRVIVEYRDADNQQILFLQDSGLIASTLEWAEAAFTNVAPADTRWIRVRLVNLRNSGLSNDAFFDAVSLIPVSAAEIIMAGIAEDDGLPAGSSVSTLWSVAGGPASVSLSTPGQLITQASFRALGPYVLRLSASDSQLSAFDEATVVVEPANKPPVVNAGPDQTAAIVAGTGAVTIDLSGAVSDDLLPEGITITAEWKLASGPSQVTFGDINQLLTTATFARPGTYLLRLEANDSEFLRADEVMVRIYPPNLAPVVNAGPDKAIFLHQAAGLSGTVSDDGVPLGVPLYIHWSQISGPGNATFSDTSNPSALVTFSATGVYVLKLEASDTLSAASDLVTITINPTPPNMAPIVDAGPNQNLLLADYVGLPGTAVDDGLPSGSQPLVSWSKISGPGAVVFADASHAATSATFAAAGQYILQLSASDGVLSSSDTATITVHPNNLPPTVNAGPDQKIVAGANLLRNAGNEEPLVNGNIPNWIEIDGNEWTQASAGADSGEGAFPPAAEGNTYFYAGSAATAELRQDIDVSAFVVQIAAGMQQFEFRGMVRSAGENMADGARIIVEYRDKANTGVLAFFDSGQVANIGNWMLLSDARTAPFGTGWIRVRLLSSLNSGNCNQGFFDALSLRASGYPGILLHGIAGDDGLPFGALDTSWTMVSGPGTVIFTAPVMTQQASGEVHHQTAALISSGGTYVLRLTATDGQRSVSDDLTITFVAANQRPNVDAGPGQAITLPEKAILNGTVEDDGLPQGALSVSWGQVSGPGSIVFSNPTQAQTDASFSLPGVYVLSLTASDGELVGRAEVTVTVSDNPVASRTYTTTADFNEGKRINVNSSIPDQLQLDDSVKAFNFIWVAVSTKGTIVKINTETGQVLGEYYSSPQGQPKDPSRTTVDLNGNVWLSNRAGNSVVHIGLVENGQCEDRNGNGIIDTSTGLGDIRAWPNTGGVDTNGGVSTAADECMLHYVRVSSSGTRHVSVTKDNDVWVSGTGNRIFNLIDGATGQIKRTEGSVGYGGYGGLIDKQGVIWSANSLLRWDTSLPLSGSNGTNWTGYSHDSYGLCIDSQGNVWNTALYGSTIRKFAPNGTLIGSYGHGYSSAQGCVVDENDDVWVAHVLWGSPTVGHLKNSGAFVGNVTVPSGPTGVAVDAAGKIWSTNYDSRNVSRIDPNAGPIGADGVTHVGAVDFTSVNLGGNLYNYSDMTGSTLTGIPENGTWSVVFDSGLADNDWGVIGWRARIFGDGAIMVSAASSGDGVSFGPSVSISNGIDFDVANGRYLRITVNFHRSSTGESPILYDLTAAGSGYPLPEMANEPPVVNAGSDEAVLTTAPLVLKGSAYDDGLPATAILTTTWSQISGPGIATFANPAQLRTSVTFSQAGAYVLQLTATDSEFAGSDEVNILVDEPSELSVYAGPDQVVLLADQAHLNGVIANASGTATINWLKASGPGDVTFADPASAVTTASFSALGTYVLQLMVSDVQLTRLDEVVITVRPVNLPPVVHAGPDLTIVLPNNQVVLNATATDDGLPTGSTLSVAWSLVSGPGAVAFGNANTAFTNATFTQAGTYALELSADDSQLVSTAIVRVVVRPLDSANTAPVVDAGPNQTFALSGTGGAIAALDATVTDEGLPLGAALAYQWTQVSGPASVSFSSPHSPATSASVAVAGTYVVRLTVSDSQLSTSDDLTLTVGNSLVGSPENGSPVTGQVPITLAAGISVTGGTVEFWPISAAGDIQPLASGITASGGDTLAILDTALLANGSYIIRLSGMFDGTPGESLLQVTVVGENKPGRVTFSVTDFVVPLVGLPIEIRRSYDSLDRNQSGDFGYGWKLDVATPKLEVDAANGVTLTINGKRSHFYFAPQAQNWIFGAFLSPLYTPEPGFFGKLSGNGCGIVIRTGPGQIQCFLDPNPYHPTVYAYTDPYGRVYTMGADGSLKSIKDLNGNLLSFTPEGITSSAGNISVPFVRDTQGRIERITDPRGKTYRYIYNAAGELENVIYPEIQVEGVPVEPTTHYTYDPTHIITGGTDARNHPLAGRTYYPDGRLESVTEWADATTSYRTEYSYNAASRTTSITDPNSGITTTVADEFGHPVSITDPLDHTITMTYNAKRLLESITDALGHITSYTYDTQGNLATTTYPRTPTSINTTSTTIYNEFSLPIRFIDQLQNEKLFHYDENYIPESITDGLGTVQSFRYDSRGNLLASALGFDLRVTPNKATTFTYDTYGNKLSETDPLGNSTSYTYDTMGRVLSMTPPPTGTMDADPSLRTTRYTYDDLGNQLTVIEPLGRITHYEYDANGNKILEVDPNGHETRFEYDFLNRLVRTIYPDSLTTSATYTCCGLKETETDQQGRVSRYQYDPGKRLLSITRAYGTPDAAVTGYEYDDANRLTKETDPLGHPTDFAYDEADRLIRKTDALLHEALYSYDDAGRRASILDANSHETMFRHDERGQMLETTFDDDTATHRTYDEAGRVKTETDQELKVITNAYDDAGNLISVTYNGHPDPIHSITTYGYTPAGQLSSITDMNGHVTLQAYDLLNRLVKKTLPGGSLSETYTYDAAGNLKTRRDFNGKVTSYEYDDLNRLSYTIPDPSLGEATIRFTYTGTGKRETMTDASGITVYHYDALDRVKTKATPQGTLSYTWDAAGNLRSINSSNPNGASVNYEYDERNLLKLVADNRLGGTTTYSYDPAENLQTMLYPNGVQSLFTYNRVDQLSNLSINGSSLLANYAYGLAPTGRKTSVTELNGRRVDYSYDGIHRLTSERISNNPESAGNGLIGYSLDPVGNRLLQTSTVAAIPPSSATHDDKDRIGGEVYDNNGNTLDSGGMIYSYDFENRIISSNDGQVTIEYDGDGNRVAKTVNGVTTRYLVDNLNPTSYAQVFEEIVDDSVQRVYTYGHRLISQHQLLNGIWTTSYYGYDCVNGSVRFLTDAVGQQTDTYTYDAFGNSISLTGSTPNIYLYRGEQYDPDLQLYYLRARFYDARVGRFLSRDPLSINDIGVWGSRFSDAQRRQFRLDAPLSILFGRGASLFPEGSLILQATGIFGNAYAYANGDPVNAFDPTGLMAALEYTNLTKQKARVLIETIGVPERLPPLAVNRGTSFAFAISTLFARCAKMPTMMGKVGCYLGATALLIMKFLVP